jgi:hypothetical protein
MERTNDLHLKKPVVDLSEGTEKVTCKSHSCHRYEE